MSTTYRYTADADALTPGGAPADGGAPAAFVYTRIAGPTATRLEATLAALLHGDTVVYATGLAAFHALLVHTNPARLLVTGGYHGCLATARLFARSSGMQIVPFAAAPRAGDLVHLESPLNPDGTAGDIGAAAARAHAAGAWLSVDATLAPPPLQDPFALGADFVLHSATKYIGGHSDMLAGSLSVRSAAAAARLRGERTYLGATMGNLEAWLGLRSVKTMELRVARQSANGTALARWLAGERAVAGSLVQRTVAGVSHASLQDDPDGWIARQMPGGFGPVFSIVMRSEAMARTLPSGLVLWGHATSLGGVESLIEWRAMSDDTCPKTLLRLSTGVENVEDLKADLIQGLESVLDL